MGRKQDNTGRSKGDDRFVKLPYWLLESPAFMSLSTQARAVLIELMKRYNGSNNGKLYLSVRDAKERCNVAKDTASRAFHELEERGFVERTSGGDFGRHDRKAQGWRLTMYACDLTGVSASKVFMTWGTAKWRRSQSRPADSEAVLSITAISPESAVERSRIEAHV